VSGAELEPFGDEPSTGRGEASTGPVVEVRDLGRLPYGRGLRIQDELVRQRRRGAIPDQLLYVEHPHVITRGSSAEPRHILVDQEERSRLGLELRDVGRGGDVTYHGPGQLVGYPILDLKPDRKDLHRYLRDLEAVLVRALAVFGVEAWREEEHTGVWTEGGKVAAIGVRVSSGWITSHGFALNVAPDLSFFETIVPCGIDDRPVTSLRRLLGRPLSPRELQGPVTAAFGEVFERKPHVVRTTLQGNPNGGN